jgi:hypothetical protein
VKPCLHPRADAWNVLQLQFEETSWKRFLGKHRQSIRLLHVAGNLGQQPVWCETNRAFQAVADVLSDASLDPAGEIHRKIRFSETSWKHTGHLVNGMHLGDGDMPVHFRDDELMEFDVTFRLGENNGGLGTETTRLMNRCSGFDAEAFGFEARCDIAGKIGVERGNDDWPVPQLWPELLFAGGKERVQIQKQPVEAGGFGQSVAHRRHPKLQGGHWWSVWQGLAQADHGEGNFPLRVMESLKSGNPAYSA